MAKKAKQDGESQASATAVAEVAEINAANWRAVKDGLHLIPLELVIESAENARKTFTEEKVRSLAQTITEDGGMNAVPAIVRPIPPALEGMDGACFELLDGARRFRALQLNGAKFIKAEVQVQADGVDAFKRSLLCNLQREDLNPVEKGAAFAKLMESKRYQSVEAMAKALGMEEHSRSVRDLISLRDLIPEAQAQLIEGKITLSHAVLIAREDAEDQPRALKACFVVEQEDNGAGFEPVVKLVTEKKLRDWIKDFLRPAAEPAQPDMFESEEAKEADAQAKLEKEADEILARADRGEPEAGSAEAPDASDATEHAGPQGLPRKPDHAQARSAQGADDDDLTPEQAAAVKPDDAEKFAKLETKRLSILSSIVAGTSVPLPSLVMKMLACKMAGQLSANQYALLQRVNSYFPAELSAFIKWLDGLSQNAADQAICARSVLAMALLSEVGWPEDEYDAGWTGVMWSALCCDSKKPAKKSKGKGIPPPIFTEGKIVKVIKPGKPAAKVKTKSKKITAKKGKK